MESQKAVTNYKYYVTSTSNYFQAFNAKTRQEARTKAIKKRMKFIMKKFSFSLAVLVICFILQRI